MKALKSAIAVITYRRLPALQEMLQGLRKHCAEYPTAIFEDCGNADDTCAWLQQQAQAFTKTQEALPFAPIDRPDLMACQYPLGIHYTAFLGALNLGVAGNSNRALKWFMDETDADHLLLCNDDLLVLGNFADFYAKAHQDLGVGFFTFNNLWNSPTHRWIVVRSRGYRVRVFQRMTGCMMSVTRTVVNKVGYFDTRFGRFGEEHCDWTNRIRFEGFIKLDGLDQMNLDPEPALPNGEPASPVLQHQDVPSCLSAVQRGIEDRIAAERMQEATARYWTKNHYRPFALLWMPHTGANPSHGINTEELQGYTTAQT